MHKTQLVILSVLSLVVASFLALVGSSPASAAAVVVRARADGQVDSRHPGTNYGRLKTMSVAGGGARTGNVDSYLRFDLSGQAGRTLERAVLRVRTAATRGAGSKATHSVHVVADDSWTERGITYKNAPARGAVVGTLGPTTSGRWSTVELSTAELQAHVGSMLSLAIDTASPDRASMRTRETTADPSLSLTFASTSAPATSSVYSSPSHFGLVREGIGDPSAGWVKTLTSKRALSGTTVDQDAWRGFIQRAWQYQQVEMPMVTDDVWTSGSIADIQTVMRQFFEADPRVPVWEMGREENLKSTWEASLPDTARKLAAVEEVKNSINPDIKLAYQIVNRASSVETFLKSDASDHVDILALHLYHWPDFQSPEPWLEPLLAQIRALEDTYHKHLPIWVTESGAPSDEAGVQLYSNSHLVSGISLPAQADYLAKMYATSLNNGVKNLLWYELEDDNFDPKTSGPVTCAVTNVECHMGIQFADGTPKPAYHAFTTLSRVIGTKAPSGWRIRGNTRISTFRSATQEVDVVWNYPAGKSTLPLSAVGATSRSSTLLSVTGEQVAISGDSIGVTGSPRILVYDRTSPTLRTVSAPAWRAAASVLPVLDLLP